VNTVSSTTSAATVCVRRGILAASLDDVALELRRVLGLDAHLDVVANGLMATERQARAGRAQHRRKPAQRLAPMRIASRARALQAVVR
jgi:hypothetical protein